MYGDPYLDAPVFWVIPGWAAGLSNLYFRLRFVRRFDEAARRRYYRYNYCGFRCRRFSLLPGVIAAAPPRSVISSGRRPQWRAVPG